MSGAVRRRILLTGATGVMGTATVRCIMSARDSQGYSLTVLARDSARNRAKLAPWIARGMEVVWGDLLDAESVARAVAGADIVLHVGGMVSPLADKYPDVTIRVNVGSVTNIVEAARHEEERGHEVAVVYIGSVSQYGPRREPYHWGRAGDLVNVARFDAYALSKVMAEKIVAESGLRRWVSLRQSGILHVGLLMKADDPIAFHVPLRGAIEWVTDEDSGRLMERVCRADVPEEFWCNFYNIGGGEKYRLSNYEFERMVMSAMGCPSPEKSFDARWFATDNFHGMWYEDSDRLEDLFHFRSGEGPEEYFNRRKRTLPWYFRLAPLAPGFAIKAFMKSVASKSPLGPLSWLKNGDEARIDAFFGGRKAWAAIPKWKGQDLSPLSREAITLDHGYDESLEPEALTDEQLGAAARHRGGEYLGGGKWRCAEGHEFAASPRTILKGGHWCPDCLKTKSSVNWRK